MTTLTYSIWHGFNTFLAGLMLGLIIGGRLEFLPYLAPAFGVSCFALMMVYPLPWRRV